MQGGFGKKNFILRKTIKIWEKVCKFSEKSIAVFKEMWYNYSEISFYNGENVHDR